MCGLLPPLPFDLPSCPGLPDSLVSDQVTSSECMGDEEQAAHNSRGDFRQKEDDERCMNPEFRVVVLLLRVHHTHLGTL